MYIYMCVYERTENAQNTFEIQTSDSDFRCQVEISESDFNFRCVIQFTDFVIGFYIQIAVSRFQMSGSDFGFRFRYGIADF